MKYLLMYSYCVLGNVVSVIMLSNVGIVLESGHLCKGGTNSLLTLETIYSIIDNIKCF